MRRRIILPIVVVAALLTMFALSTPLTAKEDEQTIPFVGMTLVYDVSFGITPPTSDRRAVSVLYQYEEWWEHQNVMLYSDFLESQDYGWNWVVRDINDRTIVHSTSSYWMEGQEMFCEFWIPTNIKIGDQVKIYDYSFPVVGDAQVNFQGRSIDCWKLQASRNIEDPQPASQNWTMFYDKKTGIQVSVVFALLKRDEGYPIFTYGGHLVNTNALIG